MSRLLHLRRADRTRAVIAVAATVLFLCGSQAAHAAFPGANGKIAFDRFAFGSGAPALNALAARHASARLSLRGGGATDQIFTMNPDGSGETNVSNNGGRDNAANWTADGMKIAYYAFNDPGLQVFSMNPDGSSQTDLSRDPSVDEFDPAWSPTGAQIAFTHDNPDTGNGEIWVMNADGSGKHLLVRPAPNTSDDSANWSPDGTKIVFTRWDDNDVPQIYVANADGSGTPQDLSNDQDADQGPNWSPDGTKIVFYKYVGADQFNSNGQIWVMNADGSGQHVVTASDSWDDEYPAWSPDGTEIVYQAAFSPREVAPRGAPAQQIWVVNADGSNPHQVSTPPDGAQDYEPSWQPVGSPVSAATFPTGCTATGSVVVHVADPTHFISALGLHYKVDGGAEQGVAADAAGNVTIQVGNGTHTVEYWASDAAGYLEAAHHMGTLTVDTVNKCVPPAPKVGVAGVRRACVAKAFHIRVHISAAAGARSVRVYLGKKRLVSTKRTAFTLKINPKKLHHRTRLRIVATDKNGKTTTIRRTITRCAVAKPRRHAAPRFTG